MKKLVVFSVIALALSVFVGSTALAECPEGKSEVILVTPSGKVKTLCVPEAALPGLENAAEHSAGTIIPDPDMACPCFTLEEVKAAGIDCYVYEGTTDPSGETCVFATCEDGLNTFWTVYSPGDEACSLSTKCENCCYNDGPVDGLSDEEATACIGILKVFQVNMPPGPTPK
jgi:hypothetical protein